MSARARSGRWELSRTTLAAREARTHVDGYRATLGEEPWRRARLLVSELATNAVRHGRGRIELVVEVRPAGIRFSVADEGAGRAVPRTPGDDGGFGLHLVEDLADRWGQGAAGAAVWFDVDAEIAA